MFKYLFPTNDSLNDSVYCILFNSSQLLGRNRAVFKLCLKRNVLPVYFIDEHICHSIK